MLRPKQAVRKSEMTTDQISADEMSLTRFPCKEFSISIARLTEKDLIRNNCDKRKPPIEPVSSSSGEICDGETDHEEEEDFVDEDERCQDPEVTSGSVNPNSVPVKFGKIFNNGKDHLFKHIAQERINYQGKWINVIETKWENTLTFTNRFNGPLSKSLPYGLSSNAYNLISNSDPEAIFSKRISKNCCQYCGKPYSERGSVKHHERYSCKFPGGPGHKCTKNCARGCARSVPYKPRANQRKCRKILRRKRQ